MTRKFSDPARSRIKPELVCLDFDGTIMTYDEGPGFFHPDVIKWLNRFEEMGVRWCTNSGRNIDGQIEIIEFSSEKGLACLPDALICSESFIYERGDGAYHPLQAWNRHVENLLVEFHADVQNIIHVVLDDLLRLYRPEKVYFEDRATVFLLSDREGLPVKFANELASIVEVVPHARVTRNGGWVVLLPAQLGKGNVLLAYLQACRVDRRKVLAIGDHHNDISMLDGSSSGMVGCPADAIPPVVDAVRKAGGCVAKAAGPAGTVEIFRHFFD